MKSRGLAFALALSILHACLWVYAIHRDGSWAQEPPVDQAGDLCSALKFSRAITDGGVRPLLKTWVHHNPIHTPFVPAVSGALMAVFGESRKVAESVLPLFTFVLVLSTMRAVERLYGVKSAYAAAALTTSFPLFLIFSRTYHFEHPLAAMFALSAWTMLRTEGFTRAGPSIVFGVAAGFTALTRIGAPVFLVGPTLVYAIVSLRGEHRARRLANLALATAIGMAIAATWYVPNYEQYSTYLYRGTYGAEAARWSGAPSAFSWVNAEYYARWNVIQGPGVPMAAVAALAYVVAGVASRGRTLWSGTMAALAAVYAIDFLGLLAAAQREGARYFQPLMPIVALAIVRAVAALPTFAWRLGFGSAVAALALHHVLAIAVLFDVPSKEGEDYGPVPGWLLWDHKPYLLGVCEGVHVPDPRGDFHVKDVVARLESFDLPERGVVLTIGDNEFLNSNSLALESLFRRRGGWSFIPSKGAPIPGRPGLIGAARLDLSRSMAAMLRSGGPSDIPEATVEAGMAEVCDPIWAPFDLAGGPYELPDGSRARVYRKRSDVQILAAPPPGLAEAVAVFGDGASRWMLVGASWVRRDVVHVLTTCFKLDEPPQLFPGVFVQIVDRNAVAAAEDFAALPVPPAEGASVGPWYAVRRLCFDAEIFPGLEQRGFDIRMGLIGSPERFSVQSDLPVDDDGTRLTIWRVPPRLADASENAGAPPAPGGAGRGAGR